MYTIANINITYKEKIMDKEGLVP